MSSLGLDEQPDAILREVLSFVTKTNNAADIKSFCAFANTSKRHRRLCNSAFKGLYRNYVKGLPNCIIKKRLLRKAPLRKKDWQHNYIYIACFAKLHQLLETHEYYEKYWDERPKIKNMLDLPLDKFIEVMRKEEENIKDATVSWVEETLDCRGFFDDWSLEGIDASEFICRWMQDDTTYYMPHHVWYAVVDEVDEYIDASWDEKREEDEEEKHKEKDSINDSL